MLEAYNRFEGRRLNKNVLKSYDLRINNDFMLDRNSDEAHPYDKLKNMVGLSVVKKQIDRIIAANVMEKTSRKRRAPEIGEA